MLILGKLPPPIMGPAIATSIILNSDLNSDFDITHLKTNINGSISTMGRFNFGKAFRSIGLYFSLFVKCVSNRPKLVLIPISQTTMGFVKDAIYIWTAWITGRKILLQLRGSNWKNWQNSTSGFVRWYTRFTCRRTKGVVVLGNNLVHLFEDVFPRERIYVVPNGANFDYPTKVENKKPKLLYLANYIPTKGFDLFLKSLCHLPNKDYQVVSYGAWDNPNYKEKCKSIIEDNQLPVEVNGPIAGDEKLKCFANADAFVFIPQHPEGHPWVIVEAMAAGLPIVSTDEGAIVESVIHQENGFIVPHGDDGATSEVINKLISDPILRGTMGKSSRLKYETLFTEEKMVENLKKTFNSVIG